ncbi:MAG: cytochrome c5 family protein [Halioglobus sp.]|nr:cytochrome c5 family protein [Halioglobus sp.]
MKPTRILLLLVAVVLAGCDRPSSFSSPEMEAASRQLVPQDPEIAAIYGRSCSSCHTVAATGAPLTGDASAWTPRMAKGMDAMVDSVINGFGGMPPFGLCMDCDAQQFEALIEFMATPGASHD